MEILIDQGVDEDRAKYITESLTDNNDVIIFKESDENIIFKVLGMFTQLPKNIEIDDIIDYIEGIKLVNEDEGKVIGEHIITKRDIKNKYLRPYVMKEDIGKNIAGLMITDEEVGYILPPIKPDIEDIGKKIGGIVIRSDDVGKWFEGVRMDARDVGKIIGDNVVLTNIKVGSSLGGINIEHIGFDSPIYLENSFLYEVQVESLRNEMEGVEGAIICNRCGSTETVSYQIQTRSSDEPMTTRWTCVKCGKKGQING